MSNTTPLSPNARQIAECYAIAYPERPAKTKVKQWLNRARKASTGERGLKNVEFNDALNELLSQGMLQQSIEGRRGVAARGPSAVAGTITFFCESAVESGIAPQLLRELDSEYGGSHWSHYSHRMFNVPQHMRLNIIMGGFNAEQYDGIDDTAWYWLSEPRAKPYLQGLPEPFRTLACVACLRYLTFSMQPFAVFAKSMRSFLNEPVAELLVARAHVFCGEFDKARELIQKVQKALITVNSNKPDKNERELIVKQRPARSESESVLALSYLLQGDDGSAISHLNAALEEERRGTRKRLVYPDSLSFSIASLALLRDGATESRVLFDELANTRKKLKLLPFAEIWLTSAAVANLPRTALGPQSFSGQASLASIVVAISSRWHPDFHLPQDAHYRRWLEYLVHCATVGGYTWAQAEMLAVLEATYPDNDEYSEYVQSVLANTCAKVLHESINSQSLTSLVAQIEVWEYSLQALEELALSAKPAKKKQINQPTSETSKRVAWQVQLAYEDHVDVSPLEQTKDKNGNWRAGRRLSTKRLREQSGNLPPLLEQDIKASSTIEKVASYGWGGGSPGYETTPRTTYQLIGHPAVFDQQGVKLDVVERHAELRSIETDGQVKVMFEPRCFGAPYIAVLNAESHQVLVTRFTAAQMRIAAVIPEKGLALPATGKARLQQAMALLSNDIHVAGDGEVANEQLASQAGDATTLLMLEPFGHSVSVRFRVEPLPGSKRYFDPGSGGTLVYVPTDKGSIAVTRELQTELENMLALVSRSEVLSMHYDGRVQFSLENTVDALELLDELQQLKVRCVWPGDVPLKVRAQADLSQLSLSIKGAGEWFRASGELVIDEQEGEQLSLEKLLALMSKQPTSRFIELGNGDFLALSRTLKQQLDTLAVFENKERVSKSKEPADQNTSTFNTLGLLALDPLLEKATITGDAKWKNRRKLLDNTLTHTPDVPPTLQAELRSYQREGYEWLVRLGLLGAGACLADDMGLGKTVQTLAMLLKRAASGPALVVAPTSVTGNWLSESQRFAPSLNVLLFGETGGSRESLLNDVAAFDLVVISYGLMVNAIDALQKVHWHTVVLDEAQAIKNAKTRRAKSAKQLRADFRVITTGTPVQNNLFDLHSLFGFLNPSLLGSESAFRKRFALPITRERDDVARQQLQSLVAPFLLRRHKRDVLKELPARTDIRLDVTLSTEEAVLYEALREEALQSLSDAKEESNAGKQRIIVLSYLTKLRRLCCNPTLVVPQWVGSESKLDIVRETVGDLVASGHKALVFSQFVDHLKIVESTFIKAGVSYQYLDGSTSRAERTRRVNAFQSGEGDVFLISLTAGGTGLNLTAADYVIHLDPWWNPAVEDQATDRAHRIGQQRPVTVLRMVTKGTVEEQIQELHATKRELADSILAGADSAKLDMDALMGLFSQSVG